MIAPQLPWLALVVAWTLAAFVAHFIGMWLGVGSASLVLGGYVLVAHRTRVRAWIVGNGRPLASQGLLGVAAGALMLGATYVLYPPATRLIPWVASGTHYLYAAFDALTPVQSALALGPVVIGEELVWRGVVQTALAERLGTWPAAALAALLYGASQAPTGSILLVATAVGCGLVWGALRAWTGGLLATLLSHLLWDAVVLLVHPLIPTR